MRWCTLSLKSTTKCTMYLCTLYPNPPGVASTLCGTIDILYSVAMVIYAYTPW